MRIAARILATLLLGGCAAAHAAGSHTVTVGAVVLSTHNCKFIVPTSTLDFGNIDPSSTANVTATVNIQYRCNGGAPTAFWTVSSNDGLHATGIGAPRMRHAVTATEYLPYTLNAPVNGSAPRNTIQSFTLVGTITPAAFGTAIAGNYGDTVVLTIAP